MLQLHLVSKFKNLNGVKSIMSLKKIAKAMFNIFKDFLSINSQSLS